MQRLGLGFNDSYFSSLALCRDAVVSESTRELLGLQLCVACKTQE